MANELISIERLADYNNNIMRDANVLKRSTAYVLDNVVSKGQIVLQCSQAGTTDSTTLSLSGVVVDDELTDGTAKWKVISLNGYGTGNGAGNGLQDWESNKDYAADDIFVNENQIYKVIVPFTSGATADRATKVNNIVPTAWTANTAYTAGAIIEHQDITTLKYKYYDVTANFTSGATFEVTAEMQELQIVEEYVPNPLTHSQVQNLINNFVPSGSGTDPIFYNDSPIGTIIAYMGITAPKDYLACDGQTYNIVDYKELAEYIKVQFGSYDYFGGNGTTTFAVPDLRGEFLRGTGTNSHSNQGSGASVGVHQDGTEAPIFGLSATGGFTPNRLLSGDNVTTQKDSEYIKSNSSNYGSEFTYSSGRWPSAYPNVYTSRPTNTSVLYCIKYNTSVLSTPENNYSTEEQRIGTWIDGKPLYQKTYQLTSPSQSDLFVNIQTLTVEDIKKIDGYLVQNNSNNHISVNCYLGSAYISCVYINSSSEYGIYMITNEATYLLRPCVITLQYTKTTD